MVKLTKELIRKELSEVVDPELNISVIDLGLIYGIKVKPHQTVEITMTLTTIGCPLFRIIETDIKNKIAAMGAKKVIVKLVFNPPWTMDKISPRGRAMMGI